MSTLLSVLMITTCWFDHVTARIPSMHHQQHKRNDVGESGVLLTIARELLSHIVESSKEKRDAEETSVVVDMAREGVTLGLTAYLAFEQQDQCIERLVCDITERMNMLSSSTGLIVTAADFVTPQEYQALLEVAKDTINGAPCFYYKCGALQYHPDNANTGQF